MTVTLMALLVAFFLVGIVIVVWAVRRGKSKGVEAPGFQEQLERLNKGIGQVLEATRQAQRVEEELRNFKELLSSPKPRGQLGELLLENLLREVLPTHYISQHTFTDGRRVDACLRLAGGMVPVDAKFPLDSYKRMYNASNDENLRRKYRTEFLRHVRVHIDAVAQYIRPDEGTLDFALMYIPVETIYYETILQDSDQEGILHYALKRRVIPVSPASFYAYLQAILLGLQGLNLQQNVRAVIENLQRLQEETIMFGREFQVMGDHLRRAFVKYDDAAQRLQRVEHGVRSSIHFTREMSEPPDSSE